MSKMLEAWKKFCDTETAGPTGNFEFDLFSAGYQAAIAAIREGGPVAWMREDGHPYRLAFFDEYKDCKPGSAGFDLICHLAPAYKLPGDLT